MKSRWASKNTQATFPGHKLELPGFDLVSYGDPKIKKQMIQSKNWKHPPGNSIDRWLRWHLRPNFSREARRDPLPAGRHRLLCQLSPRDRRAFGEPTQIWRLVQGDQLSNISSKLEAKGFKPKWFNHAFPKGIHHIKILIWRISSKLCVRFQEFKYEFIELLGQPTNQQCRSILQPNVTLLFIQSFLVVFFNAFMCFCCLCHYTQLVFQPRENFLPK